jgi:hypothetical protein
VGLIPNQRQHRALQSSTDAAVVDVG